MAPQTYSTIPAAAEEQPLSQKQAKSYKSILAGAAVASFILGVMAATAVTSPSAPKRSQFLAVPGVENAPACAGAKQRLDACTAKNAPGQKCEVRPNHFEGFQADVIPWGTDPNKCEYFFGAYEVESFHEDCWKNCDAEMQALARCANGFQIKNKLNPSLDCICANNPYPSVKPCAASKIGCEVPPPNRVDCKPGKWQDPATLPTDICEAGTFCDIDCAKGYASFDEAKGCANAGKGYCCKDTKPAKYPFTPNTK